MPDNEDIHYPTRQNMDTKQLILNELLEALEQTPEQVQYQVLDFVRFLAHQRYQEELELEEDLEEIRAAREDVKQHGTIPWEQVKAELGLPQ
jgi:hypothetical protein